MAEGKIVVTLKGGKNYDEPWLVIHAESVAEAKAMIEDALGVDAGTYAEAPLINLVGQASKSFQAPVLVESILGGTEIKAPELGEGKPVEKKAGGGSESPKKVPTRAAKPKAKAKVEEAPEKPAEDATAPPWDEEDGDPILKELAEAPTVVALRRIWARNKAVWNEDTHGKAIVDRKKELEG